jgi:peptide/nickel transport system substrate-binding protein
MTQIPRRALLAAPALVAGPVRAQGDSRPVMRVAVQALPPTLEPLEAISNVGLRMTSNVFDTLWRRDFVAEAAQGGQHLGPFLATSLEQRDPLSWVVTLREGVRLQDGGTLSAADLLSTFSAERMWGPSPQTFEGRVNFGHLTAVEAEGPHRVVFRTARPDPIMPHRLAAYGGWIHSAAFYAREGQAGMRTRPVGTGPYRVSAFQRDQRVVLDAFDEHWQGAPPARQVVFTVVPEASSRLAGLRAGDYDLVTNLLPEQADSLRGHATLEGVSVPLDFAHILYYDTRRPALRDVRVRRALNHAVDYDTLGTALWGPGFRRMAALQIPAFGRYFDEGRVGFRFDPDLSRRLLREAGYRGEEIVVRIAPAYYLQMLQGVQVIQQMWAAVGVNSRLETRENLSLLTQPGADVRPTSIAFRFPDPLGGGLTVHLAREFSLQQAGFWQPVRYNEILDALRAAQEPEERRRLWFALMDEFEAEAPALILYPIREYIAKRRAVRWQHPPLYYMDFRPGLLRFEGAA